MSRISTVIAHLDADDVFDINLKLGESRQESFAAPYVVVTGIDTNYNRAVKLVF